jgi:hypothetical protein
VIVLTVSCAEEARKSFTTKDTKVSQRNMYDEIVGVKHTSARGEVFGFLFPRAFGFACAADQGSHLG